MKLNDILIYIDGLILDRFVKDENINKSKQLLELDDNSLTKSIIRLKRINRTTLNFYRTFLFVEINESKHLNEVLQWTASVKSSLTDPETSDLYLIVVSGKNIFSDSESIRIEATEQFCKKYVQRGDELPANLIERTNLAMITTHRGEGIETDPVDKALLETGEKKAWFDLSIQKNWKIAFESEKNGNELLDLLK